MGPVGHLVALLLGGLPPSARAANASGTAWDHLGWACLRRTTRDVRLEYPADAEAHFEEIHRVMHPWAQPPGHRPHSAANFFGPWVENLWIDHARRRNASRFHPPRFGAWQPLPLSAVFGPFIPLLLTWTDVWVGNAWSYPPDFKRHLRHVLRPHVPYVTVNQNDEGVTGKCELPMEEFPNLLVFSSGGYGHVPIPLFAEEQRLRNARPLEERRYLVSYVGGLDHSPNDLRGQMKRIVEDQARSLNFTYLIYKGPDWKRIMADSRVSLAPRGWGRTAYHVVETIQMGLIPVYIYSDVPWVPYRHLFRRFGYVVNVSALPALLGHLSRVPLAVLRNRERLATHYRDRFLGPGVLRQIFRYLTEEPSDLRCTLLPATPKGEGPCR